jgi:hypothetical protein
VGKSVGKTEKKIWIVLSVASLNAGTDVMMIGQ